MDITLGGRYLSRFGEEYTVLEILLSGGIKVRYLKDNTESFVPRIDHNIVLQKLEEKRRDEGRFVRRLQSVQGVMLDYFTLGYLAHHGYFYAKMPADYEDIFIKDYARFSGKEPSRKEYHIEIPRDDEWFAVSTSISFGATDVALGRLDFADYEATYDAQYNRWRVSWNNYFFALISLGFCLGANQDTGHIMRRIVSRADREEFVRGYDLRKELAGA
ncbi:hypothetical protein LCGC14_1101080 [marine sediment metagenome]|uniref:Uncharacterized protein n=1 Tax=marine sediment metagenome TaxID=412755 RepID=A0A0F9PSP5_9ZZZZ